jgi:acyl carrier protein
VKGFPIATHWRVVAPLDRQRLLVIALDASSGIPGISGLGPPDSSPRKPFDPCRFTCEDLPRVEDAIRTIVGKHGRLSVPIDQIRPEDDLYRAGMTSHASVNVMLALEAHFEVEFPERMLRRSVFETLSSIQAALAELR